MSETKEKYIRRNTDDMERRIEEDFILASLNRLLPVIEKAAKTATEHQNDTNLEKYIELERLALDLAHFTLDYYKAKNRRA